LFSYPCRSACANSFQRHSNSTDGINQGRIAALRRRARLATPRAAKPIPIIAQVEGSGTAVKLTVP
jgi:hypothetical protein